jgi:hypothetical protein
VINAATGRITSSIKVVLDTASKTIVGTINLGGGEPQSGDGYEPMRPQAAACRRIQDGGCPDSAAIACQVRPRARRWLR